MRPPKAKKPGKPEPILDPPAQHPVKGAELLLSMVEARCAAANGNGNHMDSRGVQELDQIEAHIANLEAVAEEQDEDTGKQIEQLRTRIEALRNEMAVQHGLGRRRNWLATLSALTHWTTLSASSPIGAKFTATVDSATTPRSFAAWRAFMARTL